MNTYTQQGDGNGWIFDTGATVHMSAQSGMLSSVHSISSLPPIIVGNGSSIPVTSVGHSIIPTSNKPLMLNHVLVALAPNLVQNLISVRQFTEDNHVSVEFDPFGLSVKDLHSREEIVRCNSTGDPYPLHGISSAPA